MGRGCDMCNRSKFILEVVRKNFIEDDSVWGKELTNVVVEDNR